MVSPRIWVSCAVGEDAPQGTALAQRLIDDLRNAGAEVVSERATLPDEQYLPFLQQELASCQWLVLVQTPQGMGSRRAQLTIQEALSRLQGGLLRGACLVSALSDGWGEPVPGPEMRSYTYQGDYPRLRDKLLLDLNLLQITGLLGDEVGDTMVGRFPPVQGMPGVQPQATTGSAERLVPFQARSGAMDKLPSSSPFQSSSSSSFQSLSSFQSSSSSSQVPSSFQLASSFGSMRRAESMTSQYPHQTTGGDRPVPLRFSLPRPSRRFWLYGLMSIFSLVLIVSGAVLAKDIPSAPPPVAHPTPITLMRPSPTPTAQPTPTPTAQPTPMPAAPPAPTTAAPKPPPAPTCGTTSVGPFSLAANTVYEWPGGAPWFATTANCGSISINFSQLTHPVQMQVCIIGASSCNAWQPVKSTGTRYQIASGVAGKTSYRFGIKTGTSAATIAGKVSE